MRKIPEHLKGSNKYNLGTSYKHYRNAINKVSETKYSKVVKALLLEIRNEMLEGHKVILPFANGGLEIVTKEINMEVDPETGKRKAMRIDFNESWKLWHSKYPELTRDQIKKIPNKPIVYFTNAHSDGTFNQIAWNKSRAISFNKAFYSFKASKGFRKLLSEESKKGKQYNSPMKIYE